MNKLIFAIALGSMMLFADCTKQECDIVHVNYGEYFTIKTCGKYCFPDDNYFEVKNLVNEFCPCNCLCLWEGEMVLFFSANMDGVTIDTTIGSSELTNKVFVKDPYTMHFKDIEFEEACSNSNLRPEIISASVMVSK
ncbi:MAG TPA: hypothetical protein DCX89_03720 [Saprospirales bacterium]|mgnify:CR=1 FL=1|nr:hypothetical protein [Saprospirales bacterium]HAY70974.1 hypothetical protein [Saprospirales bacterium]HRQ28652.1 hypothetical protein [Saprospiraceae bacterium]